MELINNIFHGRTLLICMIFGFLGVLLWWLKFQKQLNLQWKEAVVLSLGHFVIGTIAMRMWAILEVGGNLEEAANLRLYGAMFLLPPFYFAWAKLTKRDVMLTMDISGICGIIGLVIGRINCMLSGCCEGMPMFFGSEMRWPLREIELIYCAVVLIYYGRKILKGTDRGQILPKLMISYGVIRFIMEWVREEYTGTLGIFHLAHIWSLIAIVVGAVMYYKVRKNIRPGETRRNDAKSKRLAKGGKAND